MLQVQAAGCTSTAACTFSIPSPLPETENLDPAGISFEDGTHITDVFARGNF